MTPTDPKLVFVGGLHRSGTTILAQLLAEHPQVSGLTNTGVPHDEGQHLQDIVAAADQMGGPGRFAFDSRAHLVEDDARAVPRARERLVDAWRPYWDSSAAFAVEKSPPNLLRLRFFRELFPDAFFVVIVRHPVAVALATEHWAGASHDDLFKHWLFAHEQFERDRPRLARLRFLHYEHLVAEPQSVMTDLDQFLGLEPQERTLEIRAGTNMPYFRRFGYSRLTRRSLRPRLAAARFGNRLDALGYGYHFTDRV